MKRIHCLQGRGSGLPRRGEYNVYSTFQSHEPEFDYLKSLEIEEKINKIRWLRRPNPAHFLLSTNGKRSKFFPLSRKWLFLFENYYLVNAKVGFGENGPCHDQKKKQQSVMLQMVSFD